MISPEQMILRLLVAGVLGGVIGLERERLEWAAGMRTHALVCVGSALFMLVSAFGFYDVLGESNVVLDPSRVAAQVASGIGFIGAGTIIFRREILKGLTTAASVWAVAAVGLAVGGGMYLASIVATLIALVILILAKPLKKRIFPNRRDRFVRVEMGEGCSVANLQSEVEAEGLVLDRIVVRPRPEGRASAELVLGKGNDHYHIVSLVERLRRLPAIYQVDSELVPSEEEADDGS